MKVVNLSISGTASSQTEALLFRRLHDQNITVGSIAENRRLRFVERNLDGHAPCGGRRCSGRRAAPRPSSPPCETELGHRL
ncbi:MAG: hypothetical protein AAB225_00060, partial [Acidobacteriota bacterium]